MRTLDDQTNQEITNPDLSAGYLIQTMWASPEAYSTIDNITKFALYDEDYEEVMLYHRYTAEEVERMEEGKRQQEHQEVMDSLPDAVAELSTVASDNATTNAELGDAVAELSILVSDLMTGGNNG